MAIMSQKEKEIFGLVLTINKVREGRKVSYEKYKSEYGIFMYKRDGRGGYGDTFIKEYWGTADEMIEKLNRSLKFAITSMVEKETLGEYSQEFPSYN